MEARAWTGDDDREFGPTPEDEACWCCGVGPMEDCLFECFCGHCMKSRPAQAEQAIRDEVAKKGAA